MDADASAYGVGAVISHVLPKLMVMTKPIAFASRALTPAKRNYAQIEEEALALIFGVKSILVNMAEDLLFTHQPLLAILGPKKGIPSPAAARFRQWSILLAAYLYDSKLKPTN